MRICVCVVCTQMPPVHRCATPYRQLFLCGQVVLKLIQMGSKSYAFLANSQHKYPRRNTEVTLGSTIFQSPVYASPASQITPSLTASRSVVFSLLLFPPFIFKYLSPFPFLHVFPPSFSFHLSTCLSVWDYFSFTLYPLSSSLRSGPLPHFLVFTPGCLANLSRWQLAQPCPTAICQHLFNLTSARIFLTFSHLSYFLSAAPVCLSFTCVTRGSLYRVQPLLFPGLSLSLKPTWSRCVMFSLSCHILGHNNTLSRVCIQTQTAAAAPLTTSASWEGNMEVIWKVWMCMIECALLFLNWFVWESVHSVCMPDTICVCVCTNLSVWVCVCWCGGVFQSQIAPSYQSLIL